MDAGRIQRDDRSIERRRWLARHARTVVRLLRAPPERWDDPSFRREVEDTRRGLVPIRTREALVASFTREGALIAWPLASSPAAESPVPVAYAIRWHELGQAAAARRGDVPTS